METTTTTNQTTESNQDGAIKKFNQKLREIFHPGIKLAPQEEVIMNIIYKILGAPGTIKITPAGHPYYLINSDIHYFVRIDNQKVTVVNTVSSISRDLPFQVAEFMREAIFRDVLKDADIYEKTIFSNEMAILNKITEKIENDAENTHKTSAGTENILHK